MLYITLHRHRGQTATKPREEIKNWVDITDSNGEIIKIAINRNSSSSIDTLLFKDEERHFEVKIRKLENGDVF